MSFEITIETTAAEATVTSMIDKLQVLPVPVELTTWQVVDMRRKRPNTEVINPVTATTRIWPRGRPLTQLYKRPQRTRRVVRPPGRHPILRPMLFDKLRARMRALMGRELQW